MTHCQGLCLLGSSICELPFSRILRQQHPLCCAGSFFWFLFFMFTALQYCTMYGFLAVALTPDLMTAAVLSSAFYGIWNLTAGFIMPQPVSPRHLSSLLKVQHCLSHAWAQSKTELLPGT